MEEQQRAFEALAHQRISRNRDFQVFNDPLWRKALRRHRLLASLERETRLLAAESGAFCRLDTKKDGYVFHIARPLLGYQRTVWLTDYEWAWLAGRIQVALPNTLREPPASLVSII